MCRDCCRPILPFDFVNNHFAQKHPNFQFSMENSEIMKTFRCPVCLREGVDIKFPFPVRCHSCYKNADKDDREIRVFGVFLKEKRMQIDDIEKNLPSPGFEPGSLKDKIESQ